VIVVVPVDTKDTTPADDTVATDGLLDTYVKVVALVEEGAVRVNELAPKMRGSIEKTPSRGTAFRTVNATVCDDDS
jgi:hypothetical protein